MQKDLKQIKGVLPPLYFFIERAGFELMDQKFITLDKDGNERKSRPKQLNWQRNPGVKLTLRQRETKRNQNGVLFQHQHFKRRIERPA